MRTLVLVSASALAGALVVVACSDDSPGNADAAVCDCPASEAPLSGRIVRVRGDDAILVPGGVSAATAQCGPGAILLHGWCDELQEAGTQPTIAITSAGAPESAQGIWTCVYKNYTVGGPNTIVHAEAVCLMPAQ